MLKNLKIAVSPTTLLRLVKRSQTPVQAEVRVRVLGVDDFAFRRGHTYGTILLNLETHTPLDLLPDRSAATLSEWLKVHPEVELISRDRSTEYALGATIGAPQAQQVADRWHILKNWREVIERILHRLHSALLAQVQERGLLSSAKAKRKRTSSEQSASRAARKRRIGRYDEVLNLSNEGKNVLQIAEQLQMSRVTVRKYLTSPNPPPSIEHRRARRITDPYLAHLQKRWAAGCHNAKQLWREVVEQGFAGSYKPVQRWVSLQRAQPGRLLSSREQKRLLAYGELKKANPIPQQALVIPIKAAPQDLLEALPPRQLAWIFVKQKGLLTLNERKWLKVISEETTGLDKLYAISQEFVEMVRTHTSQGLEEWLAQCSHSGFMELVTFGEGLNGEYGAIAAGLDLRWSNGPVEGAVNRLKFIKRSMYGRAGFELLRQKVLKAS